MKKELQGYLEEMLKPLKQYYSEDGTSLRLGCFAAGYGMNIADMEGLSRVLWGLTPVWTGSEKDNSEHEFFKSIYRKALVNGTNPLYKGYFGDLGHRDQRMVEMAAISLNLLMNPESIWNTLKVDEKQNLANWLYQINDYTLPDNNWNFFNVITNVALKKVGMKYSHEKIEYGISRYESYYLGNGWYSDGNRPQKDYYSSFGIHYYCLLYAMFMEEDTLRCRLYKDRAKEFAKSFIYWFDEEGKALPFGRSLTYRFAQVAFFSVYVTVLGEEIKDLGVIKGLIGRHFRYWMNQPIFDNGGVLSVGYTYPNSNMAENYNSPGSPYWAFKSFLCLSLGDDHPFWKVEEEKMPKLDKIYLIKESDMLIQHRNNEVVALTAGQYPTIEHTHSSAKYAKFAYSSRFGISVPRSNVNMEECAPDCMLAFSLKDGIQVRRRCLEYKVTEDKVWSIWSPSEGILVESTIIPRDNGHIRSHKIQSDRSCKVYDCGFSYPKTKDTRSDNEDGVAMIYDENGYSKVSICKVISDSMDTKNLNYVVERKRDSTLSNGSPIIIQPSANTNIIYPLTHIPAIEYEIQIGVTMVETMVESYMEDGFVAIGRGDCYELLK